MQGNQFAFVCARLLTNGQNKLRRGDVEAFWQGRRRLNPKSLGNDISTGLERVSAANRKSLLHVLFVWVPYYSVVGNCLPVGD